MLNSVMLALEARGQVHMVLGGGKSPLKLHEGLLADARRSTIDWSRVHIWVSDERMVPFDHPDSNAGMIWRTLCGPLGIKREQLHGPVGNLDPIEAAGVYNSELEIHLQENGEMDISVLGIGDDGHTASLFPGGPWADGDVPDYAMAVGKGPDGHERVSMMPSVLRNTKCILLLVNTPEKRAAMNVALDEEYDPIRYPLQIFRGIKERVTVVELT